MVHKSTVSNPRITLLFPIFLVVGPKESYRFYGFGEWHASYNLNTVRGHQRGPQFVEFADGSLITFTLPWMNIHGIIRGDRIIEYEGVMEFRDEQNGLSCDLEVNPKEESSGGFFGGWFSGKGAKLPTDYMKGRMVRTGDGLEEVICYVQGTWLGCIEFDDDERLWDFNDDYTMYEVIPVDEPLPSDCRYRDDVRYLAMDDKENAQAEKVRLEEKQRAEAKLRKEGEKLLKKKAKKKKKNKEPAREPRIFKRPEPTKKPKEKKEQKKKKKKESKKQKEDTSSQG